jgi:hypothetical protein
MISFYSILKLTVFQVNEVSHFRFMLIIDLVVFRLKNLKGQFNQRRNTFREFQEEERRFLN